MEGGEGGGNCADDGRQRISIFLHFFYCHSVVRWKCLPSTSRFVLLRELLKIGNGFG